MAQAARRKHQPLHTAVAIIGEDRLEIFEQIKEIIEDYNFAYLSEESGVSEPTLYNWINGYTKKPRLDTITKVANAVGYRIRLIRRYK